MVIRGAELEYDNFEVIRRQSHVIKVTQRSKTAGNITGFWVINSMEATILTLEVNTRF